MMGSGVTDNLIINNIKIPLIGNDIIDLRTAAVESNWRRPNYLSKIFTPEEQSLIKDDKTVWWLWSAKESVYKIINRATLQRRYAPLSITWFSENIFKYEGEKFFIKSEITDEFIHTIAVANPELFPQLEVCKDPTIKYYKDENGMPMIDNQPVSISHHGRYWAMVKQKIFKAILPV
ncbi:4'-phosphopantetheinyl transferase superfamily protein [Chitinophaga sp. LS1]|uniref:4'-phosphopantetheinyl transferase family protein n=1 Tax=Chitinophaga sp. LS1 TaxID=3051176 RepID=UPI002AAA6A69|nr:4'-phosphopantetheinyl transferase superfamily protein [Chitinophaga sp. LS1]WPV65787.1 4'-phosphopantetheinyl transferase superfamily protein [Chitinophaga sp. LS1]